MQGCVRISFTALQSRMDSGVLLRSTFFSQLASYTWGVATIPVAVSDIDLGLFRYNVAV